MKRLLICQYFFLLISVQSLISFPDKGNNISTATYIADSLTVPRRFPLQDSTADNLYGDFAQLANGNLMMVWQNDQDYIHNAVSTDGGLSWGPRNITETVAYSLHDLTVFQASTGRLFLFWGRGVIAGQFPGMRLSYSNDSGRTWADPYILSPSSASAFTPNMTENDSGLIWLTYSERNNDSAGGPFSRITSTTGDTNTSWSNPQQITASTYDGFTVKTDGNTWLAFWTSYSAKLNIWQSKSTDNGNTWSAGSPVFDTSFQSRRPRVVKQQNGTLVMAFVHDEVPIQIGNRTFSNSNIYYRISTDTGKTWQAPQQFTKFPGEDNNHSVRLWNDQPYIVWSSNRTIRQQQLWYGILGVTKDTSSFTPIVWFASAACSCRCTPLTLIAGISSDATLQSVSVSYRLRDTLYGPFTMYDDGMHGDSLAGDHIWGVQFDGFNSGDAVTFVVEARDINNNNATNSAHLDIYLNGSPPGPSAAVVGVNNFTMWARDDGLLERRPQDYTAGVTFPAGTATVVFAAGFVWGGLVQDGRSPMLRVGGQNYNYGTVPGRIISRGVAENPTNPDVRLYRVRRHYETDDLRQETAALYAIQNCIALPWMVDSVRAYYRKDWLEWPWQKGAPFYDRNHNGIYDPDPSGYYDPTRDEPGLADADQVLWFVANDLDPNATRGLYGSPPIGIEEQMTIWGYNRTDSLGNCLFQRCRIIYKGTSTTPDTARIDGMYIAKWSDPDIGDYRDDFVGCDTSLQLGYAYNSQPVDAEFQKFNLVPPAVEYNILQGPIIHSTNDTGLMDFRKRPGYKNLPMTTFMYLSGGSTDYSPDLSNYSGTQQWYNILQGYRPRPISPAECFVDPTTSQCTMYELTGDPVLRTGWIDGVRDPAGDRQIVLVSGPFSMALGDTQEVVVALIGALGSDHLNSVSRLKSTNIAVREFYNNLARILTEVESNGATLPLKFALYQSYPNPFNPATKVRFDLPRESDVRLTIYNILGQQIAPLVSNRMQAGKHEVTWDASNVAGGVYFYQLRAGNFVDTKKMLLVR